ncbi:MAG: exodeoxyribonuclease VII small subunit [Dethiosulfovibrio sp.]|nr:exodeoxyribonuclease VII small subunit [Dethiosulfovibrio sp.]
MNFSEKMSELEGIVKKLEGDVLPLEESISLFEDGREIVEQCRSYLDSAERKITLLTENGEVVFDGEKGE